MAASDNEILILSAVVFNISSTYVHAVGLHSDDNVVCVVAVLSNWPDVSDVHEQGRSVSF